MKVGGELVVEDAGAGLEREVAPRGRFGLLAQDWLKPQFRTRVATGPVAAMLVPGVPSVTPISVTPLRIASKSRQLPAAWGYFLLGCGPAHPGPLQLRAGEAGSRRRLAEPELQVRWI